MNSAAIHAFLGTLVLFLIGASFARNHLIDHYELLTPEKVFYTYTSRHSKRSTLYTSSGHELDEDLTIHLTLSETPFTLILTKVEPPLREYHNVSVNGQQVNVDRFYDGFVSGFPSNSLARGFINHRGNFEGHVTVGNETWIIESSDLVLQDERNAEEIVKLSPTVAFKESDLNPSNFVGRCGVTQGAGKLPSDVKVNRAVRQSITMPKKRTCEILVVVDHTFSEAYKDDFNDITHAVTYFVKEADNIFQNTVFGDTKGYMIKIGRFEIFPPSRVNSDDYPFKGLPSNVGSSEFLKVLSEKSRSKPDWNKYCLVYAFTNRDFDNVLGEAYTGGNFGGICKLYRQGIVTMQLQGDKRSKLLVALTFAHEAGHSWGSGHDSGSCSPGGTKGNYLMDPSAQPGTYENNVLFSPCSRDEIADHLSSAGSMACFQEPSGEFCGNNVVEGDEECDCGFADSSGSCHDKCCHPAAAADGANTGKQCTITANAQCSPTADECCAEECVPRTFNEPCGTEDECAMPRVCPGGSNYTCPKKENAPNGQLCKDKSMSCRDGFCVDSACAHLGGNYEPCSCDKDQIEDSKTLYCVVCCRQKGAQVCQPITELEHATWPETLFISDGDICSNNDGYCDVFHRCRSFAEEGLLLKVITRLFSADKWSDFATQYWWAIALIVISLCVIIGVFVHCCAIYTPTQNPNVKQYKGPKSYIGKRYSQRRAGGRPRATYDAPDSAAVGAQAPKPTISERTKKTASKMTNKRRKIVAPPNYTQQTSST